MSKITHDFWLSSDVTGLDSTLNPYSVLPHTCFVPVIFLAYIYIPVYIIVKIVQNSKYFSYIVFQICDQYLGRGDIIRWSYKLYYVQRELTQNKQIVVLDFNQFSYQRI